MNKYDYGYELTENTTIMWAYKKISPNSTILELGPSNGNLVYHLTQDKHCIADIVEIDENAGSLAARFCRNSCLGVKEGNLEGSAWYEKLKNNLYDYIIVLDVLEHVRNPGQVLELLRILLKAEGTLLLSIPNIAHNSVILNLLRNKFEYTSVGLLDDTHVHFYTYDSIKLLLNQNGFVTIREEVKQENVGNNEVIAEYGWLPSNVDAYLKTRELGTAYQFLFTLQKGEKQPDICPEYIEDKMYEVVSFNAQMSTVIKTQKINPLQKVHFKFSVKGQSGRIRIDPLNANCIVKDILIKGLCENGENICLKINEHTGNKVDDLYVFYDNDPQIYIDIADHIAAIDFSCSFICFDNEALSYLSETRDLIRTYKAGIEELRNLLLSRETERDNAYSEIQEKNTLLSLVNEQLVKVKEQNEIIVQETNDKDQKISFLQHNIDILLHEKQILQQENIALQESAKSKEFLNVELNKQLCEMNESIWGKIYHKTKKIKGK